MKSLLKQMDIFLIRAMREETGAGLLDCKNALEKYRFDFERAKEYLGSQSWKTGKMITYSATHGKRNET